MKSVNCNPLGSVPPSRALAAEDAIAVALPPLAKFIGFTPADEAMPAALPLLTMFIGFTPADEAMPAALPPLTMFFGLMPTDEAIEPAFLAISAACDTTLPALPPTAPAAAPTISAT
ncbi:hypothetical protein D3C80_1568960 [compost metagenome]